MLTTVAGVIKQALKAAACLLFILFAVIVLLECALRAGIVSPTYKILWNGEIEIALDRTRLYFVKPRGGRGINNYGYHDTKDFSHSKTYKRRVIILGDSFVMGHNLAADRTFPAQLESLLGDNYEVYNMGVSGYGPDQSLIQLRDEALKFKPDILILSIFPANDFNDIYKDRLLAPDKDGGLIIRADNAVQSRIPDLRIRHLYEYYLCNNSDRLKGYVSGIDRICARYSELLELFKDPVDTQFLGDASPEVTDYKIRLMRAILHNFREITARAGIPFFVVIIPSHNNISDDSALRKAGVAREKYAFAEDMAKRLCDEEKIPNVNLYPQFIKSSLFGEPLFDPKDTHLSSRGNAVVARALYIFGPK